MHVIDKAIAAAGSQEVLADYFNVCQKTISDWKAKGCFPNKRVKQAIFVLEALNIEFKIKDLNPNLPNLQ